MSRYERQVRRERFEMIKDLGADLLAGLGCLMILGSLCIGLLFTH